MHRPEEKYIICSADDTTKSRFMGEGRLARENKAHTPSTRATVAGQQCGKRSESLKYHTIFTAP